VFTSYNYIVPGAQVFPMRAVHTREWSYVFNPWSDGLKKRQQGDGNPTENQSGLSFAAMREAASTDPAMRERVDSILLRRRDELFDLRTDPYSAQNLAGSPEHAAQLAAMKERMREEMARTRDPLLESLRAGSGYPREWDQPEAKR
jgi:N-sulfoglucosamine sulfohydrolase